MSVSDSTWTRRPLGPSATGRAAWHRLLDGPAAQRPFVTSHGRTWTYAEADEAMRRIAGGLAALGAGPGTRVLVGMDNSAAALMAQVALRELGAVLVALTPGLRAAELHFQIEHSKGELLIADGAVAAALEGEVLPSAVRHVLTGDPVERFAAASPLPRREIPGHDDLTPSLILYTSGSTSKPKGVVLPAGSPLTSGAGYADRFGVGPEDTYLLPFTVAHGVGALIVVGMYLHTGCHVAVEPRFSPSSFWERVEATGATVSLLFPAQLQLLLETAGEQRRETSLRTVITHADNPAFRDRFGIELGTVWGSTETGAQGAGALRADGDGRGEGYVGPPLGQEELAIREDADEREGVGEVLLRHRHAMLEYLDDPAATAQTLRDGWIHCGDFGSLDPDGSLRYRGRLKNMIKRSGENISPEEIEIVLAGHDAVVELIAFGVPDRIRTEELAVVVVSRRGVDPAELSGFVADRLAAWKAPRYVSIVSEPFPRVPSGKIDRVAVRDGFDPGSCWDRERERVR
jgi:acyl-CoA synthetase (AMP-forming)/AMP-acid ligase II